MRLGILALLVGAGAVSVAASADFRALEIKPVGVKVYDAAALGPDAQGVRHVALYTGDVDALVHLLQGKYGVFVFGVDCRRMLGRAEGATLYRKDMTVVQSRPAISDWRPLSKLPQGIPPLNRLNVICAASPQMVARDPRLPGATWRQAVDAGLTKIAHPAPIIR